jgi:hypothetical protein
MKKTKQQQRPQQLVIEKIKVPDERWLPIPAGATHYHVEEDDNFGVEEIEFGREV